MRRPSENPPLDPVEKPTEAAIASRSSDSVAGRVRTWVPELDHLRTLAILAVLAIHTSSGMTNVVPLNGVAYLNLAIFAFTQYAVPLFIFISGFALALNHAGRLDVRRFYRHRALGILPQYLIFSALYLGSTRL